MRKKGGKIKMAYAKDVVMQFVSFSLIRWQWADAKTTWVAEHLVEDTLTELPVGTEKPRDEWLPLRPWLKLNDPRGDYDLQSFD